MLVNVVSEVFRNLKLHSKSSCCTQKSHIVSIQSMPFMVLEYAQVLAVESLGAGRLLRGVEGSGHPGAAGSGCEGAHV